MAKSLVVIQLDVGSNPTSHPKIICGISLMVKRLVVAQSDSGSSPVCHSTKYGGVVQR